jgi:hypothetical protein
MVIRDQETSLTRRLAVGVALEAWRKVPFGDASKRRLNHNPAPLRIQAVTIDSDPVPADAPNSGIKGQRGASMAHADSWSEQSSTFIEIEFDGQASTRECQVHRLI